MKARLGPLLFLLLPTCAIGAARPEEVLVGLASRFDPVPWAGNRYSSAVATAPAWLAMEDRPEIAYGQVAADGIYDKENLLFVRSRVVGFATESLPLADGRDMRRYQVSIARRFHPTAALGLSYMWTSSEDDDLDRLDSWDAGLAWQPAGRVQVAANVRNLLRTELGEVTLGRIYEAGVRAAVFPRRLALFAEARRFAGEEIDEIAPVFGIEAEPLGFLKLRGRTDTEGTEGLGIEITYSSSSIGFHYIFAEGDEEGSFAYIKLHIPRG
jgi:hypothetical protein